MKMQRIQNMCAKRYVSQGKCDSSKQALLKWNWLPIKIRIEFKILTFFAERSYWQCTVIQNRGFSYKFSTKTSHNHYVVPVNKCKSFNDRSFSTVRPKLDLPLSVSEY